MEGTKIIPFEIKHPPIPLRNGLRTLTDLDISCRGWIEVKGTENVEYSTLLETKWFSTSWGNEYDIALIAPSNAQVTVYATIRADAEATSGSYLSYDDHLFHWKIDDYGPGLAIPDSFPMTIKKQDEHMVSFEAVLDYEGNFGKSPEKDFFYWSALNYTYEISGFTYQEDWDEGRTMPVYTSPPRVRFKFSWTMVAN